MDLIILAVCAFILIFNLIIAMMRGTRKSLLRLITVLVAVLAAYFLSRALARGFAREISLWMEATIGADPNFASMLAGENGADEAVATLAQMLIAPLLFLLSYSIFKGVLFLVYWLLAAVTRPETEDSAASHFIALPIGLVIAFIGIFAFITPVFGYLDVVSATITEADNGESIEKIEKYASYNNDFVVPALETPVVAPLYNALGVKLFDGLTAGEWNGEELHLKTEMTVLGDLVGNAQVLGTKSPKEYGDAECAAVEALAANVGSSHMLSVLFAGVLNTASNHWLAGEPFMNVPPPDLGANGNLLLHAFLEVFSTSTHENLGDDLDFFADVFVLAIRYDLLSALEGSDEQALAAIITDTGFLKDTQTLLATHPRMHPVGLALIDVGMRSALKAMGLPEDLKATYAPLLEDMSAALKNTPVKEDGSIDHDVLSDTLVTVFAENDIVLNEASIDLLAEGVADHFTAEELAGLTTPEVVDKLVERFNNVNISGLVPASPAK